MAFEICPQECSPRAITNGPVLLHLGRDAFRIAPQIKFCDVMIVRPFPVGFFAYQLVNDPLLSFLPQRPPEPIQFFNVGIVVEVPPLGEADGTLKFFNVASEEDDIGYLQAGGTVLFFNVSEEEDLRESTVLFFNVSDEEICL